MAKISSEKQAEVNAELLKRFGSQASRSELLEYRTETGIDPKWIRRNPACRIGRGLYAIPGASMNVVPVSTPTRKLAKHERAVLPTPFDDGAYDTPTDENPFAREPIKDTPRPTPDAIDARDEVYVPTQVYITAYICLDTDCPGRKNAKFVDPEGPDPKCECGSGMRRHSWAKKISRF
jgi:hypothetical protein